MVSFEKITEYAHVYYTPVDSCSGLILFSKGLILLSGKKEIQRRKLVLGKTSVIRPSGLECLFKT